MSLQTVALCLKCFCGVTGFWFAHCHMEYHTLKGMALIWQVGELEQMPPLPKNFKKCGNFEMSWEEFENLSAGKSRG